MSDRRKTKAELLTELRTARRQVSGLRESEARFRTVLEHVPDYIALLDRDGTFLYLNRTTEGFDLESVIGTRVQDYVPESVRPRLDRAFAEACAGRPSGYVTEGAGPGGTTAWYEVRVGPVPGDRQDGAIALIATDITERRRAEQALHESELKYRTLFFHAPICIHEIDLQGRLTAMNAAGCKMLGLEDGEAIVGTRFVDIVVKDDRERVSAFFDSARRGESAEFEFRPAAEPRRTFRSAFIPIERPEGGLERITGITEDVTERRLALEAIQESEAKWRSIAENSGDHVMILDRDGKIRFINRTVPDLQVEDVLGVSMFSFLEGRNRQIAEAACRQVLDTGSPTRYEVTYTGQDGSLRSFEARVGPLKKGDSVEALTVSATDVTDRERAAQEKRDLEAQIQQTQKLESLGVLAGGIAHDFNNLLTGILGNASLALNAAQPEGRLRGWLEQIETAAVRAADLTRQMLAYSGKGQLIVAPTDLNALAEEMSRLLHTAVSKRATLDLALDPSVPPIEGDATQIRQVIMNLITNASDALGDAAGSITLKTGTAQVIRRDIRSMSFSREASPGRYVFLEVTDSGIGMDAETQERIFEPFFTTKFTGRGLGMAAVLGIVRAHHGAIAIDSRPGHGTTVRLLLRPARRPLAPREQVAEPSRTEGKGTILVIDDEETLRRTATSILVSGGFGVLTAADGAEGIRLYEQHRSEVALVLLDLTMPELDGQATLHELRRRDLRAPVIMMSGYSEEEANERTAGHELAAFIHKPFRSGELLARVHRALDG